ncbi:MAG: hypothetical protein HY689_08655 [Chloroflexi bacterium]|nr:hypothetical protein [Chloroflexota bacterium]
MQRRILPDCCEDWVLAYGGYYNAGQEFACLECGALWRKEEAGRYRQASTGTVYREVERRDYRSLGPETGPAPLTERCCTQVLLTYGPNMRVDSFACPVCRTPWSKRTEQGWVPPREIYTNERTRTEFTIQQGPTRRYLLPVMP